MTRARATTAWRTTDTALALASRSAVALGRRLRAASSLGRALALQRPPRPSTPSGWAARARRAGRAPVRLPVARPAAPPARLQLLRRGSLLGLAPTVPGPRARGAGAATPRLASSTRLRLRLSLSRSRPCSCLVPRHRPQHCPCPCPLRPARGSMPAAAGTAPAASPPVAVRVAGRAVVRAGAQRRLRPGRPPSAALPSLCRWLAARLWALWAPAPARHQGSGPGSRRRCWGSGCRALAACPCCRGRRLRRNSSLASCSQAVAPAMPAAPVAARAASSCPSGAGSSCCCCSAASWQVRLATDCPNSWCKHACTYERSGRSGRHFVRMQRQASLRLQ